MTLNGTGAPIGPPIPSPSAFVGLANKQVVGVGMVVVGVLTGALVVWVV